ncbi:MAG: xanthine dehydrogenase family protein subunit M [Gammaproteobacteria bacterium]|nr:xanthine dehydrogenase family protein subunit M [Gammaproteobacteria bacterium]MDH4255013.1 xanthine dehydrogenase family protein subunit M [Gammaproteobacteria bacterium]MDH5310776.1 xanthine dehydrogenase family protein subunit M [Gammaproteobacteria bacterium]
MPSYDVMPDVQLYQPAELEDALNLLDEHKNDGWLLGGGQDTYGWLKDRAKNPKALIDVNGISALKGIRPVDGGLEIGAATTLREIIRDPVVNSDYALLAQAAGRVASPQIRNVGTLGGNLVQDARCWYYRRGLACYRAGGNICYADSPEGMNREHALFNASRCVAVSPSDTATALAALDATMVVASVDGTRELPADRFFAGPATHITRMTTLEPGEMLTAVRIPARWAGKRFYFEKVADRDVWDFALVSIAVAMDVDGATIGESRFVCGGVACTPYRLTDVERAVRGKALSDDTGDQAAALASKGARALNYNHFKIPLMENLVRRAIRV